MSSVRPELTEHIVVGVWSSRAAALAGLASCEADDGVIRCYLTHCVVDAPDEF